VIDHPIDRLEAWLAAAKWPDESIRPEDVRWVLDELARIQTGLEALVRKQERKP